MTSRIAPWLDGLNEPWEVPAKTNMTNILRAPSSAMYSLRDSRSRIPRPSLGSNSSTTRQDLRSSTQRTRNPLAPLSKNDSNTLRSQNRSTSKLVASRSVSRASEDLALAMGTVQQRSMSSSPGKRQETLEWKRRLVQGEVGYGDQTDLFGPSGLENIFAPSNGAESEEPKVKSRMRWLPQSDVPTMPSSPPIVDRNNAQPPIASEVELTNEEEEVDQSAYDSTQRNESFRSNPFDLESFDEPKPIYESHLDNSSPGNSSAGKTQSEAVQNRTISGQTELEQEDFSPVYISKRTTVSGQVDYAPLDSHLMKQFQANIRNASDNDSEQSCSEPGLEDTCAEDLPISNERREDSLAVDPNFSFSEDLPTGSPLHSLGHNVQFQRGGYSQQGSFKQRPLSPSPARVADSIDMDPSGMLSLLPPPGQLPPAPTPPPPSTPAHVEQPKSRSSGSPLKLFGPHDTFTNDRLMRRMSQLNPDGTLRLPPTSPADRKPPPRGRDVSGRSSFGSGELDQHVFNAEITITSASDDDKNISSTGSPGSEVEVPGSKMPLGFRCEEIPPVDKMSKAKRKLSKHSAAASKNSTLETQINVQHVHARDGQSISQARPLPQEPSDMDVKAYAEGKRPPTSPFKNPTPKRRRTLHASELEMGVQSMNESYHSQLQEVIGSRKRKDARRGEAQNTADPEVLAQRKILRPRNPTPSQQQQRRQQIQAALREATDDFVEQQPEKLEQVLEQIESSMVSEHAPTLEQQAQTLASEVAAFTLRVRKPSKEAGERKRSVTTQDFLNEAMTVMNLIRAKARPQSNLGSVEEANGETFGNSLAPSDMVDEESQLRVSRPPSREGSGWRQWAPVQTNARVISHLRKFQEQEDIDDTNFIANSIASLQVDDEERLDDQVIVVDEEANVRITGPPPPPKHAAQPGDSRPNSQRSEQSTLQTQNSGGTSTGRTLGTTSTGKSDNVGTLAPDAVAHLIGDQVGGMTFDKDRQTWVRFSKSPEKVYGSFLELPSNVTSDDDPFREISDLPVDEQNELRRLSSSGRNVEVDVIDKKGFQSDSKSVDSVVQSAKPFTQLEKETEEKLASRPVARDNSHLRPIHSSSVPSKYTVLASSQQDAKIETRATSWSDEELARISSSDRSKTQQHEPNVTGSNQNTETRSTAEDDSDDELSMVENIDALNVETSAVHEVESPKIRQTPARPHLVGPRAGPREMSLRQRTLTSRFNADMHEQSELSFVAPLPGDRLISLALSVSRPVSTWRERGQVTELQSSPSKGHSSFILSDLPDFTVHEEDEERPSEKALAGRLAHHAAREVNDRYALAVKELVKILTDVKEDEPYWEDLKQLDLHGRSLSSLYGLNDFCTGIQDMIVSNNALQQLQGLPSTVRRLDASCNRLSSLTSWNHLWNLQYLDVSNNHLDSLDGLSGLFHLRELRADDNEITDIAGVLGLDGLLKLRLRRNKIRTLELKQSQLVRLEQLDMCENQITTVENLETLCSLADLKIDGNVLTHGIDSKDSLPALKSLSAKDCDLSQLDVWWYPNLTHLLVDDNRLQTIQNIDKLPRLNTLSMRRQALNENASISILSTRLEARELILSGNKIHSLHLPHSLLHLQNLELACVGLHELPPDFGLRAPNLRTLNLNFNSIKDLRPLLNIQRLERLTACGNRISRLRKTTATLKKLKSLKCLDLRDNPLTQGFHPSLSSTTISARHTSLTRRDHNSHPTVEDEDAQVAFAERARYTAAPGCREEDESHRVRLDEEVALRRRVYELLLANGCRELREVDGLGFDRGAAVRRDFVWERLVELGILRVSGGLLEEE